VIPAAAFAFVLKREGGFVDNPADPGGATNYGVTQGEYDTVRLSHSLPPRSVRFISVAEVQDIFEQNYWAAAHCPLVASLAGSGLALVLFDCAVNSGPQRAVTLMQDALGLPADGKIGPASIEALRRVERTFAVRSFLSRRQDFYCSIVDRRPASGEFLAGWLKRLAILATAVGSTWGPSPAALARGAALERRAA
jgi:lysozyme family protein